MAHLKFLCARGALWVTDSKGSYTVPATSGNGICMNNTACAHIIDKGPIPSGRFYIYRRSINDLPVYKTLIYLTKFQDWGDWFVPIVSYNGNFPCGRRGFYLHCGVFRGSAGCIDIGGGAWGNADTDRVLRSINEVEVNTIWVE